MWVIVRGPVSSPFCSGGLRWSGKSEVAIVQRQRHASVPGGCTRGREEEDVRGGSMYGVLRG